MKDVVKPFYINKGIHIPKMHGHTRVELDSGLTKKVYEHENMMTDALEQFLAPAGVWGGTDTFLTVPTYQTLLGGILCFDKAIDTSKIFAPAGTNMTACAAYGVSTTSGTYSDTMGSYNSTESSEDVANRTIKFVYDFTTDQANGDIASVCLTHKNAGYWGYGDEKLDWGTYREGYANGYLLGTSCSCPSNLNVYHVDDSYIHAYIISGTTMTLYKFYAYTNIINPILAKFSSTIA